MLLCVGASLPCISNTIPAQGQTVSCSAGAQGLRWSRPHACVCTRLQLLQAFTAPNSAGLATQGSFRLQCTGTVLLLLISSLRFLWV